MRIEEYTDNYGNTWISCSSLHVSNIGGSGSVGHANLRWISQHGNTCNVYDAIETNNTITLSRPIELGAIIMCYPKYGQRTAFVLLTGDQADPELIKATYNLEEYACYDDVLLSRVEMEWELEAWESYVRKELCYFCEKICEHIENKLLIGDLSSANALYWRVYKAAMEQLGEYPIMCNSYCDVRIDVVQTVFKSMLKDALKDLYREHKRAWRKNWLTL